MAFASERLDDGPVSRAAAASVPFSLEAPDASPRGPILQEIGISEISTPDGSIFTTTRRLPSGEIVYLGAEPVNDERSLKWEGYRDDTVRLVSSDGGSLDMAPLSNNTLNDMVRRFFSQDGPCKTQIVELINGIPQNKRTKMSNALRGCRSGASGMHFGPGDYIAYVSKNPITGFCPLGEGYGAQIKQLDTYIQTYGHILMSVSFFDKRICSDTGDRVYEGRGICSDGVHCFYEHRGIFRNPVSMLEQTYKGLALLLHGFAGTCMSLDVFGVFDVFETIRNVRYFKYMIVNPDQNREMAHLLMRAFNESEMSPSSYSGQSGLISKFPQGENNELAADCDNIRSHIVIKTAALRGLFLESQGRAESKEAESKTP